MLSSTWTSKAICLQIIQILNSHFVNKDKNLAMWHWLLHVAKTRMPCSRDLEILKIFLEDSSFIVHIYI